MRKPSFSGSPYFLASLPGPFRPVQNIGARLKIFPNRPGNKATIGPFICEHNHVVASMCDSAFMDLEKISLSTFGA